MIDEWKECGQSEMKYDWENSSSINRNDQDFKRTFNVQIICTLNIVLDTRRKAEDGQRKTKKFRTQSGFLQ